MDYMTIKEASGDSKNETKAEADGNAVIKHVEITIVKNVYADAADTTPASTTPITSTPEEIELNSTGESTTLLIIKKGIPASEETLTFTYTLTATLPYEAGNENQGKHFNGMLYSDLGNSQAIYYDNDNPNGYGYEELEPLLSTEYQQVEYLYSSGSQRIDTGVYADLDTKLEFKANVNVTSGNFADVAGYNQSDKTAGAFTIRAGATSTGAGSQFWFFGGAMGNISQMPNISSNQDTVVTMGKDGVEINGTLYPWNHAPTYTSINMTIYLFGVNPNGKTWTNASQKWYYAKIYQGDNMIRNLIPCYRKSDNEPGMYDTVNNIFYTNAGTGEFVVGPEV